MQNGNKMAFLMLQRLDLPNLHRRKDYEVEELFAKRRFMLVYPSFCSFTISIFYNKQLAPMF